MSNGQETIGDFPDRVRDFLLGEMERLGIKGDIDGGGCDSGDWRDFLMAELRQGVGHLTEQIDDLRAQLDAMKTRGNKAEALLFRCRSVMNRWGCLVPGEYARLRENINAQLTYKADEARGGAAGRDAVILTLEAQRDEFQQSFREAITQRDRVQAAYEEQTAQDGKVIAALVEKLNTAAAQRDEAASLLRKAIDEPYEPMQYDTIDAIEGFLARVGGGQ